MSRLEKFIKDHRSDFDDAEPTEGLWSRVEIPVPHTPVVKLPMLKWIAAAALVVGVAATALLYNKKTGPETAFTQPSDTAANNLTALAPEDAPEMNQFAKLIAMKQEELKTIATEQPELYQKFAKDIDQLDSSYNNLKTKLSASPNREMLIEAMIQNLQLQLNVLNQQLNIIHQIKQSKKYSHEKNKSFT